MPPRLPATLGLGLSLAVQHCAWHADCAEEQPSLFAKAGGGIAFLEMNNAYSPEDQGSHETIFDLELSGRGYSAEAALGLPLTKRTVLGLAYYWVAMPQSLSSGTFSLLYFEQGERGASGSVKLELLGPMLLGFFDRGHRVHGHVSVGYASVSYDADYRTTPQSGDGRLRTGHHEGVGVALGTGYRFAFSKRFAFGPGLWFILASVGDESHPGSARAAALTVSASMY